MHHFQVQTLDDAPVRLLGWVTQKKSGVTYEALGINGAEASLILRWDEQMQSSYIQRRDPALVVLAYGTNEASNTNWTEASYREMFSSLIERIRRAAPSSAILVIGPGDRYLRSQKRTWKPFYGMDKIVAAQRETCRKQGCAYWDQRERMGGPGSMRDWVYAQLAQPDHTHFTGPGYRTLAKAFYSDLLGSYGEFKIRSAQKQSRYAVEKQ
jgi:lysophospholipase L1-like esterase